MKENVTILSFDEVGKEMALHVKNVLAVVAAEYGHEFTITEKQGQDIDPDNNELTIACLSTEKQMGYINNGQYNAIVNPLKSYSVLNHFFPLKNKHGDQFNMVVIRQHKDSVLTDKSLEVAYQWALDRKHKITVADNAGESNAGLVTERIARLQQSYKEITIETLPVQKVAYEIITNPHQFDVLLVNDLAGDIIFNEAAAFCNAQILMPYLLLYNDTTTFVSVAAGNAMQELGKDTINPLNPIFAVAMMLYHKGFEAEATALKNAVNWTIYNGFLPKDIDTTNFYFATTLTELVCDYITGKIPDGVKKENIELRKSTII